jgi:hypothetical protein
MESISLDDIANFFMDNLESVDEVFQFMDRINTTQRDFLNTHYSKKINGAMNLAIDKKFV